MGYELLDNDLTDSTLWMFGSKDAKILMVTILSKCHGSDIVRTPVPVLIRLAGLTDAEGAAAMVELEGPDPNSKCTSDEGRRIVRIEDERGRGLRLPSYKARRKKYLTRERVSALRERQKVDVTPGNAPKLSVTTGNKMSPLEQSRAEAEKSQMQRGEHERGIAPPALARPEDLLRVWNENRGEMLPAKSLAGDRLSRAKARLKEQPDLTVWGMAIKRASTSAFCTGSGERGWKANIDWLLRPSTLSKILEGQTDDNGKSSSGPGSFNLRQNAEDDANKRDWAAKDEMLARMKAADEAKAK